MRVETTRPERKGVSNSIGQLNYMLLDKKDRAATCARRYYWLLTKGTRILCVKRKIIEERWPTVWAALLVPSRSNPNPTFGRNQECCGLWSVRNLGEDRMPCMILGFVGRLP